MNKERIQVRGYNPKRREATVTERSRVVANTDLPLFSGPEGRELLLKLIRNE